MSQPEKILTNLLLLTNKLQKNPLGGREMLCKLNHDLLADIYGDRLVILELTKRPIDKLNLIIDSFKGHIDGINSETIASAFQHINSKNINKIFVDGSNFGEIVKQVKIRLPAVQVYTFCHNVEFRFFYGSFRQNKSLHALAVVIANYLAERKSVKFSDTVICLSERDSQLLKKTYGRKASYVSPMAIQDKLPLSIVYPSEQKYALFVGGNFYANKVGITWFVKHVAPRVGIKICIVGKGFERFKDEIELDGRVEVIGAVDSLAEWYLKSYFVIAPIFDGSGMKTKVAEALMFGKKVIGTPEAFSGYEKFIDRIGRVCLSEDDFVEAIETADEMVNTSFDKDLRKIYDENYSYSAHRARIQRIMYP